MTSLRFRAPEYQADGSFEEHEFVYEGHETAGWSISRYRSEVLRLGPGYTAVRSRYCGVCSTDLARMHLPYPLPQVIGHEVVAEQDGRPVVVEINASLDARGVAPETYAYAHGSMHTHDPERITLGINQLPGGFSPYVLAPLNAIVPVPESVGPLVASLTEPFAAALQGVEATHPKQNDSVAVLGPRRLGSLVIAALAGFRAREGLNFQITALARHKKLLDLAQRLGADDGVDVSEPEGLKETYDIVFDTTGNPRGFELALKLARRVVHVKSTNGMPVLGLAHLTDMVVDEIALVPATSKYLNFGWPSESVPRTNPNIYVAPGVSDAALEKISIPGDRRVHRIPIEAAREAIIKDAREQIFFPQGSPYPRFDLAIVSSLAEADQVIRPRAEEELSLVRARGAILLAADSGESALAHAIVERGLEIHTSRCGDFHRALEILEKNPEITRALEENLITHRFALSNIAEAFDVAADSEKSVKVIVETGALNP